MLENEIERLEKVREGRMTAHIFACGNTFLVADQAGWLPGVFISRDDALAAARRANGLGEV